MKKAIWLLPAVGLDAVMIVRRLWDLSWKLFPYIGRHRTLAAWTDESEVFLWVAFFLAGIVAILMARRDSRPLLYWNLYCFATLIVASPPLIHGVEHSLCVAVSLVAAVTIYFSRRVAVPLRHSL